MKKYLFGALALPLLFACSSEDFDEKVVGNDKFAGIPTVDATFSMDEGAMTRMHTGAWEVEYGDMFGFAWLGGGEALPKLPIDGNAWQNHPLTVVNDATRGKIFKPETSIYVGNYFLYYPYDFDTKNIGKINFSVEEQRLADGANETYGELAKTSILIGDKWTNVKAAGTTISGKTWDKAGINEPFKIYSAFFSNQTALDLTYQKNNLNFGGKKIQGATDIDYTYPAGSEIGAADIYQIKVTLPNAANSFTYAPTAEPNPAPAVHDGNFWETQDDLNTNIAGAGFTWTDGAVILDAPDANGISTDKADNKGWFWFNSLPVDDASAVSGTIPVVRLETSYGIVTINDKTLADCAWAYEDPAGTPIGQKTPVKWTPEWIKLAAADALPTASTPREWDPALHNTFVNQYGNHKGKYALDVDFSKGDMDKMHIKGDKHLQKLLKYYIASGKTTGGIILLLDKDADNEFKISKISIALLQTINAGGVKVSVKACDEVDGVASTAHTPAKIVVTQADQAGVEGLDGKTEVPALDKVFAAATDVYLSKDYTWTWSDKIKTGTTAGKLTIDANVTSITNEGTLNVTAENVQLSKATTPAAPKAPTKYTLANAAGATMNITQVTTVKNALTNLGTINVPATAELRAYDAIITNDATALNAQGLINNSGVVGVTYATNGKFNNYGKIVMKSSDAITLLSSNQTGAGNFNNAFNAGTNKLGTVVLPEGQPNALVSVSNGDETGFIEYTWTGGTSYSTPNGGIVKYNTLIVSDDIAFTTAEDEIKYIKFDGVRKTVTNSTNANLPNLKGIIVNANKSIIIEKGNTISCTNGAHLYGGAAIYQGGAFTPNNANIVGKIVTDYLGTWNTDQVVKF